MNYYNENDPFAAAWLRELIGKGLIADGLVDERSIRDVRASELRGYRQCHFFAGIGGWSCALRLAGWPDDAAVWTGSCPCQPFSVAGRGEGERDERHLWPVFRGLIGECRPAIIFGEQVAGKAGLAWLAGVRSDLEALGYAVGAADLCAAGIGAPHIRQRLYWVAQSGSQSAGRMLQRPGEGSNESEGGASSEFGGSGSAGGVGDSGGEGGWRDTRTVFGEEEASEGKRGAIGSVINEPVVASPWNRYEFMPCADGKARRIEPGSFPLANGVPARVGRLRGYGNAIVPQLAAEFIGAAKGASGFIMNACEPHVSRKGDVGDYE